MNYELRIMNNFVTLQAELKKQMKKSIIASFLLMTTAVSGVWAQGGTKSPYSQFGIGTLADYSQSAGRGMNGVGYALREGSQVNTLNPASYSGVDSLTMLFDMGLSGQFTNYKENNVRRNASMAAFEYAVASFRAWRGIGVSFGVLPYSTVGYDYKTTTRSDVTGTMTETYTGSGGLHQLFLGVGAHVFGPLSVGVNAAYLWGSIDRSVTPSSSAASNTLTKKYYTSINSYKLDFGAQWQQKVNSHDILTLGAVFGLGHKLSNTAEMSIYNTNGASSKTDTTTFRLSDAMAIPMSFGGGVSYSHGGKLLVAADFTFDKWSDLKMPGYSNGTYKKQSGLLKDRYKVAAGLDWQPNPLGRKYLEHVHYRLGVGYATPYYKINGQDGPKELSASIGLALPIVNGYNNRSVLNISGQWVRSAADGFITENTFRINVGITFNERWFMKWKVD